MRFWALWNFAADAVYLIGMVVGFVVIAALCYWFLPLWIGIVFVALVVIGVMLAIQEIRRGVAENDDLVTAHEGEMQRLADTGEEVHGP